MDILSFFHKKLKGTDTPIEELEEFWDEKAENFYQNQIRGSTYYNEAVPQLLEEKGIIDSSTTILDIGSGSGRYTIPLAKKCKSIYALDLSGEMLQFLQQEMKKNDLQNITTIKSAWPTTENIGQFDVAFAAMCPATRSLEGIEAMTQVANKYAVIGQFIKSTDTVIQALEARQILEENRNDPHNNRELLQAYFNILWELGFNPEISYLHDTFEVELPINVALQQYKNRFQNVDEDQLIDVLKALSEDDEKIKIAKMTTLAVLSWKTKNE